MHTHPIIHPFDRSSDPTNAPVARGLASGAWRRGAIALAGVTLTATAACGSNGSAQPAATSTTAPPTTAPPTTAPPTTGAGVDTPARRTDRRDEMVAADGATIHMRCEGSGAATVVLIAGFGAGGDTWSAVVPELSDRTRVCTYDRPGTGGSAAATSVQTFTSQADTLRLTLDEMGETGPFVVVGHSFGGAVAVELAARDTADVAALVLVDASPLGWARTLCATPDDGTAAAAVVTGLCAGFADPASNAEHLDVFAAFDELDELVGDVTTLGALPISVLTAVDRELPAGIDPAQRERLTRAWDDGQRSWARMSTSSSVVTVPDTGHDIQLDHPGVVIDAIEQLLP